MMNPNPAPSSPLVRFLDSFLHEQNIKWMLGVGMLILLGSSLRLVSMHWDDYTPLWKYGILLLYTGAIYAGSRITYHQMKLHRTGTVLMALTVLLLPLTFFALHWIRPSGSIEVSGAQQAGLLVLLGANLVFTGWATHDIFVHFLRKPQFTFHIAYLTLCLAGAVVPGLPEQWSAGIVALLLWAVFAIGAAKVNRHVFWLMEEERRPRILGFFPMALLGAQFLGVFAVNLGAHLEMQWWGLGCVLVALPVMLASDTLARVFQQRTGNLVQQLPQSILFPLLTGLILCVSGICLAATGLPNPYALVPTAAIAAVAFGVTAYRTRRQAFAWAGIICVLLAYQFSPLFFLELARSVVEQGAVAVKEPRLPYAFYGLTYLPILVLFTGAIPLLQKFGQYVFVTPLKQASLFLASMLLVVAFGHPKAIFPVSLAMMGMFAAQTILFTDRRLLIPVNLSLIGVAWGFMPFQSVVWGPTSQLGSPAIWLGLAAVLQLLPGCIEQVVFVWASNKGVSMDEMPESVWRYRPIRGVRGLIDQMSLRLSQTGSGQAFPEGVCQSFSLAVTLFASMNWMLIDVVRLGAAPSLLTNLLFGGLLVTHTLLWRHSALGIATVLFLTASVLLHWLTLPVSIDDTLLFLTGLLLSQWGAASILAHWPANRISQAFVRPLRGVSGVFLIMILLLVVLPFLVASHFLDLGDASRLWIMSGLMVAWCSVAAWQTRSEALAFVVFIALLGLSSAPLVQSSGVLKSGEWLPMIWSLTAIALQSLYRFALLNIGAKQLSSVQEVTAPSSSQPALSPFHIFERLGESILISNLIGTFFFIGWPFRLAACIAVIGLLLNSRKQMKLISREAVYCLANWQLFSILIGMSVQGHCGLITLSFADFVQFALPLAAISSASLLGYELLFWRRSQPFSKTVQVHCFLLTVLTAGLLLGFLTTHSIPLSIRETGWVVLAFGSLTISRFIHGCRLQSTVAIWQGEAIAAIAVAYLALSGVINLETGGGMYAILGLSLLLGGLSRLVNGHVHLRIMTVPFQTTAFWLPLIAVALGVARHCSGLPVVWKGFNSLALLLAAIYYFWRGMEDDRKTRWLLAATIVNVALTLLWRELHWHDEQLFMIPLGASILLLTELLIQEIPAKWHDSLRVIGALTILVSPTFEIVGGSWLHLLTLMVASVIIILLSIGLQIRSLVYTGTAFLAADLVAILVRGGLDHPHILWAAGIGLGLGIIALAAFCENHREMLMSKIRFISAELETWK